ncbi:MAG: sulfite dehydrogenase [Gemmatimonas sp.]|nr:sulfite dehydrogenase [Gemmatimonas sp.]
MSKSGQGVPRSIERRTWLAAALSGVAASSLLRTRFDAVDLLAQQSEPADPTKVMGRLVSELGSRAPGEQPRRQAGPAAPSSSSRTPLGDLHGIITPADLHFERHHAGVPAIDPESYELLIHGMVERPLVFTLPDLKRFPSVSRIHFLECSGNGGGAFNPARMPTDITPQAMDGLLSTSEWTGVPLATLLREVGVRPQASWIVAEGGDAAMLNRSIPLEKAMDDALIAYGQNGEGLRPEQGYPARVFLPGWEGNTSVKWVRRIEVTDQPVMSREETSNYTDPLKGGSARQFSFVMDAKSVITFPTFPYALPERGWWEVQGLAWSGRGTITGVDISIDGGRTWAPARLQQPVLPLAAVRFTFPWNWDGREAMLLSRCSDETGYVQPSAQEYIAARGEQTRYHSNFIRAWKVTPDGTVTYGLGDLL